MKRRLRVRRGAGDAARLETYEVDMEDGATLLDALEYLRTGTAPDLAYRHSCHHGSCGTCSVRLDGREVLACLTLLAALADGDDPSIVEPLAGFEPVADLAVDPGRLFRSLPKHTAHVRASEWVDGEIVSGSESAAAGRTPAGTERYVRFEDCIECGCCVSACPVSAAELPFRGPAALAAIHREAINKPERRDEMMELASRDDGVGPCDRHLACSKVCPRFVYPGKHIELLRREIAGDKA